MRALFNVPTENRKALKAHQSCDHHRKISKFKNNKVSYFFYVYTVSKCWDKSFKKIANFVSESGGGLFYRGEFSPADHQRPFCEEGHSPFQTRNLPTAGQEDHRSKII